MSHIVLKNISTSTVSLFLPSIRFSRELAPGRAIPLSEDEYAELSYDPGFSALLRGHYIVIEGVDKEKQVEVIEQIYDKDTIEQMLVKGDVTAFAKFIPNATAAEKESAVTLAVEHQITNNGIAVLIKKYCGIDLINAINTKHDAEAK